MLASFLPRQRATVTERSKSGGRRADMLQQGASDLRRVKARGSGSTMNSIKSVERALAVLKSFDDASPFLTAQEIAARIRIPRPSVYRFLKTLCEKYFL